mgnify:CR=1 FL=1
MELAGRLGIFSWFGFVMPLQERLRLIKNVGFDATTVWWEDEEGPVIIKKHEIPQMVRDEGLILENIHVPFNNSDDMWSDSKTSRDAFVARHLEWMEDCAKFDIPLMVMHVTDGDRPPAPNKYGVECMMRLVKEAEELKVKIAVENTIRGDSVEFLLSEIESPYLGLCYDSSHSGLKNQNYLLEAFKERLFATHISDNDGLYDRHWLPGNGIIDWNKIGEFFPKNYRGYLTLETRPTDGEAKQGPESFLEKAYEKIIYVRKLFL